MNFDQIDFGKTSGDLAGDLETYIPYNKGGVFRKWYGNTDYVLPFSRHSLEEMKCEKGFRADGLDYFFRPSVTWSKVTTGPFSCRYTNGGTGFDATATSAFGVQVLGVNHRITTPKYRFQLLQTEPVSDRVKEITLKVAIYEGNDPVTNIEKVTFDSASDNMEERTKQVVLVVEDRQYDKKTKYRLILRDADTDIQQSSTDVVIDRAFTDDF